MLSCTDGALVDTNDGTIEGTSDGTKDGPKDGTIDGTALSCIDGALVDTAVTAGARVRSHVLQVFLQTSLAGEK